MDMRNTEVHVHVYMWVGMEECDMATALWLIQCIISSNRLRGEGAVLFEGW